MKKAFTLVELVLYMGLVVGLLMLLGGVLVAVLQVQTRSAQTNALEHDGRYVMARFAHDVARASDIVQTGNSLTLNITGANYVYSVINNSLWQTVGNTANQLTGLDTQVTNWATTKIGDTVQINLTLKTKNLTRDYITTFGLR